MKRYLELLYAIIIEIFTLGVKYYYIGQASTIKVYADLVSFKILAHLTFSMTFLNLAKIMFPWQFTLRCCF